MDPSVNWSRLLATAVTNREIESSGKSPSVFQSNSFNDAMRTPSQTIKSCKQRFYNMCHSASENDVNFSVTISILQHHYFPHDTETWLKSLQSQLPILTIFLDFQSGEIWLFS